MEKFAVDLDKVLDEFEFNEDCAEQVAAGGDSENPTTSSRIRRDASGTSDFAQPSWCSNRSEEKSRDNVAYVPDETLDMRKREAKSDDSESINDFYNRGRTGDSKIQHKRYADFGEGEQVSLTFRNDVSQKLSQKRQNESSSVGTSSHNSYDKKLNQPNVKPRVSNVFSSLNDYINAPSGAPRGSENVDSDTENTSNTDKNSSCATESSSDESSEDIVDAEHFPNPPSYQNIVLPVKSVTDVGRGASESREKRNTPESSDFSGPVVGIGGNSGISLNSGGISVISGGVRITSGAIGGNSELGVNSGIITVSGISASTDNSVLPTKASNVLKNATKSASKVEHVYENVEIPGELKIASGINPTSEKSYADCSGNKHVYENVDFDEKNGAYERIYVGNDEDPSDPTADREVVPKIGNIVAENQISGAGVGAVYSMPQGTAAIAAAGGKKPVIGFSTIDDLSEEELNKYLAELEAEERAIEGKALYENVPYVEPPREDAMLRRVAGISSRTIIEDEDANEAPIFETVTIGELPSVSNEKLQEKAKKFPIIDYGKQPGSASGTSGAVVVVDGKTSDDSFLEKKKGPEKVHASSRGTSEARIKERRCKKLGEVGNVANDETENVEKSETISDTDVNVDTRLPTIGTENAISIDEIADDNLHDFTNVPESHDSAKDSTESGNKNAEDVVIESKRRDSANDLLPENVAELGSNGETFETDCTVRDECRSLVTGETAEQRKFTSAADETGSSSCEECAVSGLTIGSSENGFADSDELNDNNEEDAEDKPSRPQTLDIVSAITMDDNTTIGSPGATPGTQERPETDGIAVEEVRDPSPDASDNSSMESGVVLGKQPPFWIPDSEAPNCMLCDVKFNVIKRRHHCRACGKVLCNKCCSMKYRLEYQGNIDSRVCSPCYQLLVKAEQEHGSGDWCSPYAHNSTGNVNSPQGRQPNPNNPMEYCSTIPPLQQLAGGMPPPPTVMVPVGVLKREGSSKQRPEGQKSVMFSDGIRPGCDLTELDTTWDLKPPYRKIGNKRTLTTGQTSTSGPGKRQNMPPLDSITKSYIPQDPDLLPPTVTIHKGQISYHEVTDSAALYKSLKNDCEPPVMFAINRNLYAYVKITNLNCCVNKICWNVTSRGLACVGQDEIILLVETLPDETQIPKDLLIHINQIYVEAIKGNTITELGVSIHQGGHFLKSREHAGFLFIRQTFQCLQKIVIPPAPFLVGLLVHRWETPWAKVFPLRLVLRLGAEYRYYPCPLVSVRFRDAVYFEIGHTIMKVLADFRNFAYTLPGVRGLTIHMQDRTTDVLFPKNRYDQVIKGLNNSNDHVLAFASNFSVQADSHLVCMQTNTGDESSYQTQAINIHNKPRKVTGASFIVINGALKSSMGLSAKSSIVEDGLMVQIMPEKMEALKAALKNMVDFSIGCGLQGAPEPDETVNIKWVDNDVQFNLGVKSPIDGKPLDGVPSIRVHNGTDYMGTSRFIRWTEVFIIKSDDHPNGVHDPVDINKLSESIARASCAALVKLLDLLATAGLTKLGVRTTIHPENVGYEAGSEGTRLPPIYMNSLDNELIQVLHKAAQSSQDTNTVLELIFHVLDD